MLYFLTETPTVDPTSGMLSTVIMLVLMIGVFYFLLIRPENKRKKEAEQLRNSLKVGDRITTIGGICGKIIEINDADEGIIVIETSLDCVRMELKKWSVMTNDTAVAKQKKAKAEAQAAARERAAQKKRERDGHL